MYFIIRIRRILFIKLISLNTWGGKYFEPLVTFIKQYAQDTDIFCFQEIYDTTSEVKGYKGIRANLLNELKNILADFNVFYFPTLRGFDEEAKPVSFNLTHGPAIFTKNRIKITSKNNYFISKDESFQTLNEDFSNLPTPLQYIDFNLGDKKFAVFSFHGTPFPGDKLDTEERLMEAKKLKEIIDNKKGAKILVGDFNLLPNNQSIKIHEENMRNLIKEFNIEKTRSSLSPYFGEPDFQKYADYTFVSEGVEVKSFQVPDVEISDHLPMILEFS